MSLFDQAGWPESRPFWQHFQFYELPKDPWDWTAEDVVRALCEEPLVIMVWALEIAISCSVLQALA